MDSLTITAAEQAAILRAAADRVHGATGGPVDRALASPDEWAAYVKARRRVALDAVAGMAVCRALGLEALPDWLMVKGTVGHPQGLRLDFGDLGLAPYTALVTIEGESVRFRGVLPLEWAATAESDPSHLLRGISREGALCVLAPSALLVQPDEVRASLEAMAEGSASFPAPAAPLLSPVEAPTVHVTEATASPVPADGSNPPTLTPEVRAALMAAMQEHPGQPLTLQDGAWVPASTLPRPLAKQPEQEAPSDHVEATAGEMAAGVLRSAGRLLKHGTATAEVKAARLATCDACPHRLASGRCAKCGCFLAAKTGIAAEACPIGKW